MHCQRSRQGFTLIEVIVVILFVLILTSFLTGMVTLRGINRYSAHRAQAAALVDEQVSALRRRDVTTLTNQTNGPPIGVLANAGDWRVATDTALPLNHTIPNVVELPANGTSNEAGRFLLPAGTYGPMTVAAKWLAVSDSPANWNVGLWLHATDSRNGYRVRVANAGVDLDTTAIGDQNVLLEKITQGAPTLLASGTAATVATSFWFTVSVATDATGLITVTVNGFVSASETDTSFMSGPVALLGWGGVHAKVDDVTITTTGSENWNFDAETILPTGWTRFGVNDLDDATPTTFDDAIAVTIEGFPDAGTTSLRRVTVRVTWLEGSTARNYTTVSYLGKSGLGL